MASTTAPAAPPIPTLAPNASATYPCAYPPVDKESPAIKSDLAICYIPADGPGNSSWFEACLGPDPNIFTEKCVLYGQITIDLAEWARTEQQSWRTAYDCIGNFAKQEAVGNQSSYGCRIHNWYKQAPQPSGDGEKLGISRVMGIAMCFGVVFATMTGGL
ncbi:hypothetical protein EJ04DRAFT_526532 [Polyplosphaeria fusca]|uniref:Uncharacterized protein n=1 Tax=Polyplosphaeria fusca TaxID=682080 RepID=A0A9P4QP03_9PLEO|nr:hypothetical protein EJ04DRAFT_526532 [Polyplosphaeria fusca]